MDAQINNFLENIKILKEWEKQSENPENKIFIQIALNNYEINKKINQCYCACKKELVEFSKQFKHLSEMEQKKINQLALDKYFEKLYFLQEKLRNKWNKI